MGGARALEVMLSADDYDAELAERYGWINRALPAPAVTIGEFVGRSHIGSRDFQQRAAP